MMKNLFLLLSLVVVTDAFIGPVHRKLHRIGKPLQERIVTATFQPFVCPESKKTLYDVLGCKPNAPRNELKQAYHALAKTTHPDAQISLATENDFTHDEFSQIATAWTILSDDQERMRYDRLLKADAFKEQLFSNTMQARENAGTLVGVLMPLIFSAIKGVLAGIKAIGRSVKDAAIAFSTAFSEALVGQEVGTVMSVTMYDE
mmetsp:Transcript_16603/g.23400  ORF Transcript_16603/g.23400 Transcript_16603/m.23400 type:complete len:203 (-) Transcript_16603:149-757(-)